MAIPKIVGAQRDFSAGEVDEALKRSDELSAMRTGARQMINFRLLSGGQPQNRPGRRALGLETGRVEKVEMSPGSTFYLAFGDGYVAVYNAAFAQVAISYVKGDGRTPITWTAATANTIVFVVVPSSLAPQVYITYPHSAPENPPLVLTWDGVSQTSSWTIATYTEAVLGSGQKRTIYKRVSPQNITLLPSATTGSITLTASENAFVAGHVGTRLLWCGREILITGYIDAQHVNAVVTEQLPNTVNIQLGQFLDIGNGNSAFIPGANGYFLPGDVIEGAISGARAIVISTSQAFGLAGSAQNLFYAVGPYVQAQIIPNSSENGLPYYLAGTVGATEYFQWQEFVVGNNGNAQVGSTGLGGPSAVAVWDDELMNYYRGFPRSCFYDQSRLGFCDFPDAQSGIAWSAIGLPTDMYVNGLATSINADNAIYEEAPGNSRVYHVVPGMESSEFVFCSDAVYYIPIKETNPLTPGSVSFNRLISQGSYPGIQPRPVHQSILFVMDGGASLGAVQTPGYYARPSIIDCVSEFHSHLFTASPPLALAVPQAPNQYEENYAYLLRADGVVITSRYSIRNGTIEPGPEGKPKMGWSQWTGAGDVKWISAQGGDLVLTTGYPIIGNPWSSGFSNGFGGGPIGTQTVSLVETLDNNQYLDAALLVNNPPTALIPPGGYGPLWFVAGQTVYLIDLGTRIMGTYAVDSTGHIIPQGLPGENLSSLYLTAGYAWTATLEPFTPDAQPGQSAKQRMMGRRIARMAVYVSNSIGFNFATLFPGPLTPTSPSLGSIIHTRNIPAWNPADNPLLVPPLREQAYRYRPPGRAFDPRAAIIKDTPGPFLIHEIGYEVTV